MSVPPSYYEIKMYNKPPFDEICNKSREYFVLRVGWGVSPRRPELHSETHLELHLPAVKRKRHSLKFSFKIFSPYRIAWKLLHSSWFRFLRTEEMEGFIGCSEITSSRLQKTVGMSSSLHIWCSLINWEGIEEERTIFQQYRLTCRYFLHLHIKNSFQFLPSRFKISSGISVWIFACVFCNLVNIEEKSERGI